MPTETSPQLLISVRTLQEFEQGLDCGIQILDLKEPRDGPLSPASAGLWRTAATIALKRRLSRTTPLLSAALGERRDAVSVASGLPDGFDFAKVGPSGCGRIEELLTLWSEVRSRLADSIELVAVAYADDSAAAALPPETVFDAAKKEGFRRCLLDTYCKDGRSAIDHLGVDRLARLSRRAQEAGLWWTLAGSIRLEHVARCTDAGIRPDCFGVRGDVCDQGRVGVLSVSKVRRWKESLSARPLQAG